MRVLAVSTLDLRLVIIADDFAERVAGELWSGAINSIEAEAAAEAADERTD